MNGNYMTQPASHVNDAETFLSAFSGKIFIRLLHDGYDLTTKEPRRLRPRQVYGDLPTVLRWLESVASVLNSGVTPEHRFNVFYCANDPGQGNHAQQGDISVMRLIYQDCDDLEYAAIEPEIADRQAHSVIESSPGKRQRIWHIEDIDAFRHRAVHDHMCARRYHDPSTHGAHRLLRLPGFRNWKYEDGPVARLIAQRDTPRLTAEQVFSAFGFRHADEHRDNINAAAQAVQRSGELPEHKVYNLERERAKRQGVKDGEADARAVERDVKGITPGELSVNDILNRLSLIEPDMHRNDWRRVIAALHWMADGREWGKAFAEGWSQMGLTKWEPKAFLREWNSFNPDYDRPATWLTILRMTDQKRTTDASRELRNSEPFKRLEAEFGPAVEYRQLIVDYPKQTPDKEGLLRAKVCRRNVEYLLQLESVEVYYDEFMQLALARIGNGEPQEIDQKLIMELYSTAHKTDLEIGVDFLSNQIEAIALDTKRDPVREYLNSLPMWDGTERLKTVFQRLMGAPDSASVREILPLIMFAIIRRAKKPGYKFDLMPILEGKQGLGKSSFFRLLMPVEEWFGEGPKMNEEPKRLLSQLGGKLVIEFGELAGMSKQNIDTVKKLITQQVDEYIANYARKKTRAPRRCIFVGSVDKKQYLRDLSDNRRFPIIPVTTELSYAALKAERDQLWAEAMLEEDFFGELRLTPEAEEDMREMQEARLDVNTETTAFMDELREIEEGWITTETIWERLGILFPDRKQRTGHAQFLFKEIKDLMERDGWQWNKPTLIHGRTMRVIIRKKKRGIPSKIVCNGGTLTLEDNLPSIEEMLK